MDSNWDDIIKEIEDEVWKGYSDIVVDHVNNPRNIGIMQDESSEALVTGDCGDSIRIYLKMQDDVIDEISFWTDGCGSTIAAGSMVTDLAKGKKMNTALKLTPVEVIDSLGGLPEESVHCAVLATNALHEAIKKYQKKIED